MSKIAIASLAFAALLLTPVVAKAQPFTVDCDGIVPAGDLATGEPGLWVVGAIVVDYVLGQPILNGVACNTVPGASFPVVPQDGIVCFCPSKTDDTNCHAHADWTEPVTSTYCLQSPLDGLSVEEAPSLVLRNGRIKRHRN